MVATFGPPIPACAVKPVTSVKPLRVALMRCVEAALARPLRHAAGEIDFTAADFPTLVIELDYRSHGAAGDNPPRRVQLRPKLSSALPFTSAPTAPMPKRIANLVNVATER